LPLRAEIGLRLTEQIDVRLADQWPSEARIRYLEMIQSIVARMATNSFLAKGWALTVAGAIYGFAASHLESMVSLAGLVATIGFWWLDAFYLRAERKFRCLYRDACNPNSSVALFSLDVAAYATNKDVAWRDVFFSLTLRIFYGALFIVGLGFLIASVAHNLPHASISVETRGIL
jgi:hypothetical protein